MQKIVLLILLLLLTACGSAIPASQSHQTSVLYVSNAGFLVQSGDQKVLIDGITSGLETFLPVEAQTRLANGEAPFDNLTLILATHAHFDHFNAPKVAKYLGLYPKTIFISTGEAARAVLESNDDLKKRVIAVDLVPGESRDLKANGIQVGVYFLSHGINAAGEMVLNLGFLISMGGVKIFHSGDLDANSVTAGDMMPYGLPDQQIEIAFLPHTVFRSQATLPLALQGVAARYYFPMHYHISIPPFSAGLIKREFPDAILFENEMETWILPQSELINP
jgi:L-ascorbate metabolism protein UlaG (beta-lactamase superfamily)